MKTAIIGLGLTIILIISILIQSSIMTKSNRNEELAYNINTAVDQTMEVLKSKRYDIPNIESFVSEFNGNLLLLNNSNSDITVKIYNADPQMGILDVEVTEKFNYPNGRSDVVTERRTILLDTLLEE